MVVQGGIEPPTLGFSVQCSTDWATEPHLVKLAVLTGLEPAISSVTDWHVNHYTTRPLWLRRKDSNQRPPGYEPDELPAALLRDVILVDPLGLEPRTDRLWAGSSDQLSYGSEMVAEGGFEPSTSRVWTGRSSQLSYSARFSYLKMVDPVGIEPATSCVQNRRSPSWAKDPLRLVLKVGIEPTRYCYHRILSPARLPIPPLKHIYF